MERGWRFRRKDPYLLTQNDQNEDPFIQDSPVHRENSAKNTLFSLAETDNADEIAPRYDWFQQQHSPINKQISLTPARVAKAARRTFHARPFADRSNNNIQSPIKGQQESIIPRLKQQLLKLESTILPAHVHVEKRKTEVILQPKVGKKQELLVFEEILNSLRQSIRIKNTPLPRKSAKATLSRSSPQANTRKLLTRDTSSKQIRERNEQLLLMRQQVRRNRTLNNLLT